MWHFTLKSIKFIFEYLQNVFFFFFLQSILHSTPCRFTILIQSCIKTKHVGIHSMMLILCITYFSNFPISEFYSFRMDIKVIYKQHTYKISIFPNSYNSTRQETASSLIDPIYKIWSQLNLEYSNFHSNWPLTKLNSTV